MQTKLIVRENEIKDLKGSSASGAERHVHFANTPANSQLLQMKESFGSSMHSSMTRRRGETHFEKEVEILYRNCLDKVKGGNFRKNMIKIKCLAYNCDDLEIGCLSHHYAENDGILELTLFITSNISEVTDFSLSFVRDPQLEVSLQPAKIASIESGKQKKITARLKVHRIPFHLPEIEVRYRTC